MTKIKICGVASLPVINAVNEHMPDYIGFVFVPSKRQVSAETAKKLKQSLNPAIKAVGVFVNEKIENIQAIYKENIIDMVQLHGDEAENYIAELRKKITAPIIKAVQVGEAPVNFKTTADYLLFDGAQAGSGKTFNWGNIKTAQGAFLAGGINAANALEAIKTLSPYCLDISSGVETNGIKDAEKIKQIIEIIRGTHV
ncbi:MAG: phosphoribosylanthranilate isomerase [Elusimicrobia bacterium]|nr:phosphoribosylanthranilate isomerase [Elusimicrobiota bacterium]